MDFQNGTFSDDDMPALSPVLVKNNRFRDGGAGSLCTVKIARQAARTSNQRTETRRPAANEPATVCFRKKLQAGTVINTSSSGAMIEADVDPFIGEPLEIRFGEGPPVQCIARWVREGRIGVEFGVDDILLGRSERQDFVYGLSEAAPDPVPDEHEDEPAAEREPRQAVIRTAMLRTGAKRMPVRICNISPGGAMLESEQGLTPGAPVRLEMAGGVAVTASVRWRKGKRAGVSFDATVDPKGLSSMSLPPPKVLKPAYLDSEFDPNSPWAARFGRLTIRELSEGPAPISEADAPASWRPPGQ
ncbi:MAG TPA: PilZ domain-containing protein [Allosphingosinicella sp.]|jgi:hypothetical protein